MDSYNLLDALLDLIGLASTVTVVVLLVSSLQPLFQRVRDSCRAYQAPEGRGRLLWSVFLIPIFWLAAAALYFRNLISLWIVMGVWFETQPVDRLVYALLHLYLYFLLLSGIYACTITIIELSRNHNVFSDLLMIVKFESSEYQVVEDLEAQHRSSSPCRINMATGTAGVVGNVRNTSQHPQDEGIRSDGPELESVAPAKARALVSEYPTRHPPAWSDSDGHLITPSSASSAIDEFQHDDDDNDLYNSQRVRLPEYLIARRQSNTNEVAVIDQHRYVKGDNDHERYGLHHVTPSLRSQRQNAKIESEMLATRDPPSPCDSCSTAHAGSIITAKRSPSRVPITPTSPTADAEDADTEKTDVVPKRRDRKHRNSAMPTSQITHANTPRILAPRKTNIPVSRENTSISAGEEKKDTVAPKPSLAAHAPEHRPYTAGSKRLSSKANPKSTPPTSAPALCTNDASPPPSDREPGLFHRHHEADDEHDDDDDDDDDDKDGSSSISGNDGNNNNNRRAHTDGRGTVQEEQQQQQKQPQPSKCMSSLTARRLGLIGPPTPRLLKRQSPEFPFAAAEDGGQRHGAGGRVEGGKKELSVDIPGAGAGAGEKERKNE